MKYLKVYTDFLTDMEELNDAEKGRLFVMMLKYAAGDNPSPEGNERYVWGTARKQIDAQIAAYNDKVASIENARSKKSCPDSLDINMESAETTLKSREEQEQEQEQEHKQEQEQKEKKRTGFTPPTPNDIKKYCDERHNQVDHERFWDYYNDRHWRTRNGEPIDWKDKVRQWEKSDNKNLGKARNYGSENYDQKIIKMDDLPNLI